MNGRLPLPHLRFLIWAEDDHDDAAECFGVDAEDAVRRWVERDSELLAAALTQPFTLLARDAAGMVTRVRVRAEQHVQISIDLVDRPRAEGAA